METVHELITHRRSSVLFSEKALSKEIIESLFEAARWAPSSMNQQPWRFIYIIKDDPIYSEWLACLSEKNQEWARNAPLLVLTVAQVISDYNNRENPYAIHDTGMAYSNLVFQASSLGLSAHPMGGFDKNRIISITEIPDGYKPVLVAAIGYKSASNEFPQHLVDRENSQRKRKLLNEIVFRGKFINE